MKKNMADLMKQCFPELRIILKIRRKLYAWHSILFMEIAWLVSYIL